MGSDLIITGNPLWSLTHTRDDATTLGRATGVADVPEYIPRRIGEILGAPELAAAAVGGVLSVWWMRERARLLAANAGLVYRTYFDVARRFLFRAHDALLHPTGGVGP